MNGLIRFDNLGILCAVGIFWAFLLMCPATVTAVGGYGLMGPPAPEGLLSEAWVEMPAGARPAYIGIHGGTVPVSLLTAHDGQSMITLVGRTGNDFLRTLHKTDIRHPRDVGNAPRSMPESNATAVLMADTAIGNVPVFYCTGKGFARMELPEDQWQPFGLSEKPMLLEGQAGKPLNTAAQQGVKKYRRVLWMQGVSRPVISAR